MHLKKCVIKDEKGQISAEMIIVMAALIGIAIIVITRLTSTAEKTSEKLDQKTNDLISGINDINF